MTVSMQIYSGLVAFSLFVFVMGWPHHKHKHTHCTCKKSHFFVPVMDYCRRDNLLSIGCDTVWIPPPSPLKCSLRSCSLLFPEKSIVAFTSIVIFVYIKGKVIIFQMSFCVYVFRKKLVIVITFFLVLPTFKSTHFVARYKAGVFCGEVHDFFGGNAIPPSWTLVLLQVRGWRWRPRSMHLWVSVIKRTCTWWEVVNELDKRCIKGHCPQFTFNSLVHIRIRQLAKGTNWPDC